MTTTTLPSRTEFGHDHYTYRDGQRLLVGTTRTIRPLDGESGGDFRNRVHALVLALAPSPTVHVAVDEEVRAGIIVQATIQIQYCVPTPVSIHQDVRAAGGRPAGPRGARGARITA